MGACCEVRARALFPAGRVIKDSVQFFLDNVLPVLIRMTLLMNYFRAPTLVQGSAFPVNSHLMTDLRYEIASCWVGVGIISDRVNFFMRF